MRSMFKVWFCLGSRSRRGYRLRKFEVRLLDGVDIILVYLGWF